jgi:hypothetical protein
MFLLVLPRIQYQVTRKAESDLQSNELNLDRLKGIPVRTHVATVIINEEQGNDAKSHEMINNTEVTHNTTTTNNTSNG